MSLQNCLGNRTSWCLGNLFAVGNASSNYFFRLYDAQKYVATLFKFVLQIFNSRAIVITSRLFEVEPKDTFCEENRKENACYKQLFHAKIMDSF